MKGERKKEKEQVDKKVMIFRTINLKTEAKIKLNLQRKATKKNKKIK